MSEYIWSLLDEEWNITEEHWDVVERLRNLGGTDPTDQELWGAWKSLKKEEKEKIVRLIVKVGFAQYSYNKKIKDEFDVTVKDLRMIIKEHKKRKNIKVKIDDIKMG